MNQIGYSELNASENVSKYLVFQNLKCKSL